ncbi:MAG: hypothetical protein ACPG6V_02395 [Flavobacteriales bacterium]
MKRKLVYIGLCIIFLLIGGYVFRYKRAFDFNNCIPQTASNVVSINLRAVEHQLLLDGVKHLSIFSNSGKTPKNKKKDRFSFFWDINIPHALVFHSTSTKNDLFFSQAIQINDSIKFISFLKEQAFENGTPQFYSKGNINIYINNNQFWITIGKGKAKDIIAYINQLQFKTQYEIQKNWERLIEDNPMFFLSIDDYNITGEINNKGIFIHSSNGIIEFVKNYVHLAQLNFGSNHIQKLPNALKVAINKFLQTIHFPRIEVLGENLKANTEIKLRSIDTSYTSRKSIGFDDDFNRIETEIIDTVLSPDLQWDWYGTKQDLNMQFAFLKSNRLLRSNAGFWVNSMIPMLPTYSSFGDSLAVPTQFFSRKNKFKESNPTHILDKVNRHQPLFLQVKVNKIAQQLNNSFINTEALERFSQLNFSWFPEQKQLSLQLMFEHSDQPIVDQFRVKN